MLDKETPSPSYFVREGSTHKGPYHRGDAEHKTHKTDIDRTFLKRNNMSDNNSRPGKDTS